MEEDSESIEAIADTLSDNLDVLELDFNSFDEYLIEEDDQDNEVNGPNLNGVGEGFAENLTATADHPIDIAVEYRATMATIVNNALLPERRTAACNELEGNVPSVNASDQSLEDTFEDLPKSFEKLSLSKSRKKIVKSLKEVLSMLAKDFSESHDVSTCREAFEELQQLKLQTQNLRDDNKLKNSNEEQTKWKKSFEESQDALEIANKARNDMEVALSKVTIEKKEALESLKSKDEEVKRLKAKRENAKLEATLLMRKSLRMASDAAKSYGHDQLAREIINLKPITANKPNPSTVKPAKSSLSAQKRKDLA